MRTEYKMQPIMYRCYNFTHHGATASCKASPVVLVWVAVAADRIKKVLSACLPALATVAGERERKQSNCAFLYIA